MTTHTRAAAHWHAVREHHAGMSVALAAIRSADDLAAAHEEWDAEVRAAQAAVDRAKEARGVAAARLAAALGDGEVVTAPSGRVAYRGRIAGGPAKVNEGACDELRRDLPEGLRPRQETRYPTVGAIRNALKGGEITRETHDALLVVPEQVWGLRWKGGLDVAA